MREEKISKATSEGTQKEVKVSMVAFPRLWTDGTKVFHRYVALEYSGQIIHFEQHSVFFKEIEKLLFDEFEFFRGEKKGIMVSELDHCIAREGRPLPVNEGVVCKTINVRSLIK